jgi:hypothetical protein
MHSNHYTNNTIKNKDTMKYFYPANLALLIALSSFATPGFAQTIALKPPVSLGQTAAPSGWKDFRDQPGRFAVSFPKQPSKDVGKEGVYSFGAEGPKGSYTLSYLDVESAEAAKGGLEGIPGILAKEFGGKVTQSRNVSIGKGAGREFEFTTDPKYGGSAIGRVYAVDKRVYIMMAFGNKAEAKYFLNSFKLI